MTPFLRKILGMNWLLIALALGLGIFGVIAIHSVTYMREEDFAQKQAVWIGLGFVAFLVASLMDYRWIKWGAVPMYLASIGFLVLVLIIGKKVYGAQSWIPIGPFSFQPAQMAIVAGILVLALFLSQSQFRSMHPLLRLLCCAVIVGAPALLILKQPDLGETIVWGPVLLAMLFVAGIPLRYLISIILIALICLPLAYTFALKPYQKARITAFLDPEIDPQGDGWAINQSLIAIGSGGFNGKGYMAPNSQIELGFLPSTVVHNDYIFSGIGEQWGFVGGVVLVSTFAILLLTILFVGHQSSDELGLLISTGTAALIFTHFYQNIGMTISIMPITGLPLPFISYSGSFVMAIMFILGIVNSVWVHRKMLP